MADNRSTLAIIIVTYNSATEIGPCLDSLVGHTEPFPTTITVVDNASSDGTVGMVRARWPGVQVIESPTNAGFSRANNLGIRATGGDYVLLLNPATDPARDLARYVGEQTQFHAPEERFLFRAEYLAELRELTVRTITDPGRYGALIAKGDELLDWREMTGRYPGLPAANLRLLEGSDHAISDFDDHLLFILQFLKLCD